MLLAAIGGVVGLLFAVWGLMALSTTIPWGRHKWMRDCRLRGFRLIYLPTSVFGALAVLLACVGLYGVISYAVARRTKEIGIRLALGATTADVLRMILKESVALVGAGIALGSASALVTTRFISALLFDVKAVDPLTMVSASALMIAVAMLAAFIPARRAARVDPVTALRCE